MGATKNDDLVGRRYYADGNEVWRKGRHHYVVWPVATCDSKYAAERLAKTLNREEKQRELIKDLTRDCGLWAQRAGRYRGTLQGLVQVLRKVPIPAGKPYRAFCIAQDTLERELELCVEVEHKTGKAKRK